MSRDSIDKLNDLLADCMIEPYEVINMCLKWMGETEVKAMMKYYNLLDWDYETGEEE